MMAYAALDLRGGAVVQLVGGRPEEERVRLPDPAAVARRWVEIGFAALHVVDLDAALGHGDNLAGIRAVLDAVAVPVQVGGGVRDRDALARLIDAGAQRVVVGTRGVEDAGWLEAVATAYPRQVILAADVRDGRVVTRGWTAASALAPEMLLERVAGLPLAGVLVTDVGREGRMEGADVELFGALADRSPHPLIASGGLTTMAELHALDRLGVDGAVLGMALYTNTLDGAAVAAAFRRTGESET